MRLPSAKDRMLINGRTGSGKTTGAVWLLSLANYTERPWVILNHKYTKIIDGIPGAKHVDMKFRPKEPGIYIYHPLPSRDDEMQEELLWYIWAQGGIGIYLDEGYMVDPRSAALNALYTQGREKEIPMITLSQRPVKLSRFAVSESDFFMLYHMQNRMDRKLVQEYLPVNLEHLMVSPPGTPRPLPEYHSLYYDVGRNSVEILTPVPMQDALYQTFKDRLGLSKGRNRLI